MTPTAPRAPTPPRTEPPHSPRHPTNSPADARDFEQLLRDKAGQHDEPESHDDCSLFPGALIPTARTDPAPALPQAAPQATKPPPPITHLAPSCAPTPIDHPAAAQLNLQLSTPTTADTARTFEVCVKQPLGVELELLATRPVQAGESHATARWSLSISSVNLNPSALRRYSSRLDERLSSRQLPHEPVRIENDEEPR